MDIEELVKRADEDFLKRVEIWQNRVDMGKLRKLRFYIKHEILRVPEGGILDEIDQGVLREIDFMVKHLLITPKEYMDMEREEEG